MTVNIDKKGIKRIIIGGVVYYAIDFCYQWGKGKMLRVLLNENCSAKEMHEILTNRCKSTCGPIKKFRYKIIKASAEVKD